MAERLLYASAGKNGLWLAVIEKAYAKAYAAQIAANRGPLAVLFFGKGKESYDAINGARSKIGVELLTGNKSRSLSVGFNQPISINKVHDALKGAVANPMMDAFQPLKVVALVGSRDSPEWNDLPLNVKQQGLIPTHATRLSNTIPTSKSLILQRYGGLVDCRRVCTLPPADRRFP